MGENCEMHSFSGALLELHEDVGPFLILSAYSSAAAYQSVLIRFWIKGLVSEQDWLKQHRWEHPISAPVRPERLGVRWKIVHAKTNRRANIQKQAVVASTRKLSLNTVISRLAESVDQPFKGMIDRSWPNFDLIFWAHFLVLALQKIMKKYHLGWSRLYTCSRRKIPAVLRETEPSTQVHFVSSL